VLLAPTSIGDIGLALSVMVLVSSAVLVWPPAPEPAPATPLPTSPIAPVPAGQLMQALREYVARRG
jgi:hypothetical protein